VSSQPSWGDDVQERSHRMRWKLLIGQPHRHASWSVFWAGGSPSSKGGPARRWSRRRRALRGGAVSGPPRGGARRRTGDALARAPPRRLRSASAELADGLRRRQSESGRRDASLRVSCEQQALGRQSRVAAPPQPPGRPRGRARREWPDHRPQRRAQPGREPRPARAVPRGGPGAHRGPRREGARLRALQRAELVRGGGGARDGRGAPPGRAARGLHPGRQRRAQRREPRGRGRGLCVPRGRALHGAVALGGHPGREGAARHLAQRPGRELLQHPHPAHHHPGRAGVPPLRGAHARRARRQRGRRGGAAQPHAGRAPRRPTWPTPCSSPRSSACCW
jgi:hypothetical protein